MTTSELFQLIQDSEFSSVLGSAPLVYGVAAQLFHIAGFLFALTPSLLVCFHIFGNNIFNVPAVELQSKSRSLVITGLLFLALSGLFMLLPSAAIYHPNPVFWLKMKLLVAALAVHFLLLVPLLNGSKGGAVLVKFLALVSLLLWFSVAAAGRAIGFFAA